MEICEFAFSQTGLRSLREHSKGQNWPVVYLINNDKPYRSEIEYVMSNGIDVRYLE